MSARLQRPGSPTALRDQNRTRVFSALRVQGRLTQAELARETGLAAATVSNIVRDLLEAGDVVVEDGKGRRRTVHLARKTGYVIGVDYGHRHIAVAVSDLSHEILREVRTELPSTAVSADQGITRAAALCADVLALAGVDRSEVVGAGMGLPATIERSTRRVGSPSILPGWIGVDAEALATEALDLPVRVAVGNDANLGAIAERQWGAGIGVTDMAYLKLSEGVGAGLIIGGRPYAGLSGTAGEIGHTTVDEYGEVCRCGNRGCLETLISARRVSQLLATTVGAELTIAEIVDRSRRGDRACHRVLEDVGRQVGRALADLCSLLNPELIVVGGELAQASAILIPAILQVVDRCGVPSASGSVRIEPARLGSRTHVLGAIALALSDINHPRVFKT
jgi:predicted NBD/HSP70 family sugar kinase